jgi:hypothetical protein
MALIAPRRLILPSKRITGTAFVIMATGIIAVVGWDHFLNWSRFRRLPDGSLLTIADVSLARDYEYQISSHWKTTLHSRLPNLLQSHIPDRTDNLNCD